MVSYDPNAPIFKNLIGHTNKHSIIQMTEHRSDIPGPIRNIAFCIVCIRPFSPPNIIDLKFENYDEDAYKICDSTIMLRKLDSVGKTHRYICSDCYAKTKDILSEIDALSIDKMPLYLNDPNIFIAERAKDRLKAGV